MRGKKCFKNLIIINTAIFIFTVILFLLFCNVLYSFSFSKSSQFSKDRVTEFLKAQESSVKSAGAQSDKKVDFFGLNCKDLYIKSRDKLTLHAVYKENTNAKNRIVILCHGYFGSFKSTQKYAEKFYNLGYSVLCPDARAHGKSEGDIIGMGYLEKDDIMLWIDEILKINKDAKIVLFGVSMGGATVLMTGGQENLSKSVKAIISDCAYSSVYDEIDYIIKNITPLKSNILIDGLSFISMLRAGYSFKNASPVDCVKKCKVPILFIHGSNDNFVPFYMLDELFESAQNPKEKLIIEGASHGNSINKDSKKYMDTVEKFLNKYIKKS